MRDSAIHIVLEKLSTTLDWDDLCLDQENVKNIKRVKKLLKNRPNDSLQSNYTLLFYGSPGTGKTLAANLLGKFCKISTYRIDLSMVVSKYIGETEKNIDRIFKKAKNKGWILFFDEADALFGKRTTVNDAHDKYANQEVSYLMDKTEAYDGLVILAVDSVSKMNKSLLNKFQLIVNFN